MTTMETDSYIPACAKSPEDFLPYDLSDEGPGDLRHQQSRLEAAHRQCAACPLFVECLYRSVVEVDVSGYVACTTEDERRAMRDMLGVEIGQPAPGVIGAPRVGAGPVDHESVVAMRQAYPNDTCHQLAERLGCSTSTIKRHLRRERERQAAQVAAAPPTIRRVPTTDEVLDAFDSLETSKVA